MLYAERLATTQSSACVMSVLEALPLPSGKTFSAMMFTPGAMPV
jgi:hypothetical protein